MLLQLLQIPGGKLVTDGLSDISNSDSLLINKILVILLVLMSISSIAIFKYLVKKHKEELAAQLVSNAEKHAIDMGAQQLILSGKDEVIKTLKTENEYLKEKAEKLEEDKTMIIKDTNDAFKQLGLKVGQLTDAQIAILGELKQNHSDMKLYLYTEIKTNSK